MIIVLFGAPGAGKGTIGELMESSLGIPLIGTGELIRDEIAKGSEIGKEADKYVSKGELVPNDIMMDVLSKKLDLLRKGYILDGFPRTLQQLKLLDAYFESHGKEIDNAFFLTVRQEVAVDRLSTRLTCTKCGKVYNVKTNPPKVTGICDKCGKAIRPRDDEAKEIVLQRMLSFQEQTMPVILELKKRKLLIEINAEAKPGEIIQEILKRYSLPK